MYFDGAAWHWHDGTGARVALASLEKHILSQSFKLN